MHRLAEVAFGLICSCLVVLPRLYRHLCLLTEVAESGSPIGERVGTTRKIATQKRNWVELKDAAPTLELVPRTNARAGSEEVMIENALAGVADDVEKGLK